MELSRIQQAIVESSANHAVCVSVAGSGKTATLTARAQRLLEKGARPDKMVIITFTNCAAEELMERLNYPQGLFIGTVHSYASYLLRCNGESIDAYISESNFDAIIERVNELPLYAKQVDYLFLDEGQDSTPLQYHFILNVIKPKNWMIFADHRQCIYEYNGADPQYLLDLMAREDVTVYQMNENYRCAPNILDFARQMLRGLDEKYLDFSIAMRKDAKGVVQTVPYDPVAVAEEFANMIDGHGQWFVLTRTNKQLEELRELFEKYHVPYDTFKRAEMSNKELQQLMRKDTVKLLTIHSSKGLERPNVLVVGARMFSPEERRIAYVAATRARDRLVWTETKSKRRLRGGKVEDWS